MTTKQMREELAKDINHAEAAPKGDMRNWLTVSASRYMQVASTAKRFAIDCNASGYEKEKAFFQTAEVSARARADMLCTVFAQMFPRS